MDITQNKETHVASTSSAFNIVTYIGPANPSRFALQASAQVEMIEVQGVLSSQHQAHPPIRESHEPHCFHLQTMVVAASDEDLPLVDMSGCCVTRNCTGQLVV